MRGNKKRKTYRLLFLRRLSCLFLFAVIAPTTLGVLYRAIPLLQEVAKSAAVLSATITMSDAGLELLKERFRAELHGTTQSPPLPQSFPEHEIPPEPPLPQTEIPLQSPSPSSPASSPASSEVVRIPRIPDTYAAPVLSENFAGSDGGTLIRYQAGYIKNDTAYSNQEVEEILTESFDLRLEAQNSPQVLIMHTHATESYEKYDHSLYDTRNTWRSTDNHSNMVAVGDVLWEVLESYGIGVLHDTTQHDYPSYNGSYERSAETIRKYLEEYPSIKVVLDVHRDAMARDDAIVKPIALIDGKKAAQIMIISGCDDGSMNMPHWRDNLRFAAAFQSSMEQIAPELTRPIYLAYRKYNQDLTVGSLLLEFGSNANTLEEACYSAELAGHALAKLIGDHNTPSA